MSEVAVTTSSMMRNYPLISAIVAFAIAQAIKFFTTWFVRFVFLSIPFFFFIVFHEPGVEYCSLEKLFKLMVWPMMCEL